MYILHLWILHLRLQPHWSVISVRHVCLLNEACLLMSRPSPLNFCGFQWMEKFRETSNFLNWMKLSSSVWAGIQKFFILTRFWHYVEGISKQKDKFLHIVMDQCGRSLRYLTDALIQNDVRVQNWNELQLQGHQQQATSSKVKGQDKRILLYCWEGQVRKKCGGRK